eukprot:COSAG02_NODE_37370_length_442_cov_8.597668_1_plen_134_part_00
MYYNHDFYTRYKVYSQPLLSNTNLTPECYVSVGENAITTATSTCCALSVVSPFWCGLSMLSRLCVDGVCRYGISMLKPLCHIHLLCSLCGLSVLVWIINAEQTVCLQAIELRSSLCQFSTDAAILVRSTLPQW